MSTACTPPIRGRTRRATKYDEVGYLEVMTKDLKVMDATAIAFCRDNEIPIVVFDMSKPGSLRRILHGGRSARSFHRARAVGARRATGATDLGTLSS